MGKRITEDDFMLYKCVAHKDGNPVKDTGASGGGLKMTG